MRNTSARIKEPTRYAGSNDYRASKPGCLNIVFHKSIFCMIFTRGNKKNITLKNKTLALSLK